MKKIFNISALLAMCLMILAGCQEEMVSTDQYAEDGVTLKAFGPSPVMRGGELRFLGTNLDKVVEVLIPGVDPITEITVVKSGIPSEIRVTVPKDGPEPGFVTLKTADGKEIVTKTLLTFSEPIVIESLTPASVAPGETLTIKGDYFNLIHEVIFAEGVLVSEKDFKKHDRYEIQVVVPVEARTGVVGLGDLDELNNEDPELFANVIYSEEELVVAQPEVTKMEAPRYKAGETVKITGKNFQYVEALNLPGAAAVEFTKNTANTEITFVLPAAAQDGEAVLVAKSGVEVVAGKYETVVPTELAAAPQPVKAGATLTITGKDIDLVTGINFPGKDGVEFQAAEAITLTVPEEAYDSVYDKESDKNNPAPIVLNMANGKSVTVAYTLVKPAVTELPASASAGSDMTITGTDLDLVKSVTFGGDIVVEVEAKETEIIVAVPTTAETAALKLNLANGTSVETESVTIDKPVACYITELPGADVEIHGGQVLIVPVANEDKLTGVQVNGEDVKFLLNNTDLYISIPKMAKEGTVIRLISSNGAVEYVIDCIPDNRIEKVIWSGSFDFGEWKNNFEIKPAGLFTDAELQVGQNIRIYGTATSAEWAVQIYDGLWAGIPVAEGEKDESGNPTNAFKASSPASANFATDGYIEFVVTEAIYESLTTKGDWGNSVIFNGTGFIITKVSIYYEISLETLVWEGNQDLGNYDVNYELKPNDMFVAAGIKAGQTLRFYITPKLDYWSIQVFDGHWGKLLHADLGNQPSSETSSLVNGAIELKVTDEMVTAFTTLIDWGYAAIIQGNCILTKITLE